MRETVFNIAEEKFGVLPDYPFTDDFNTAVLRHKNTRKWFGIIMNVDKRVLGLEAGVKADILNVKVDQLMMGSFLREKGIFPAYHMSKSSWVSVLLDGSVSTETIEFLLGMSFHLTDKKIKPKKVKDDF